MKLATYKWNIGLVGGLKPIYYYGFKTKKDAIHFVEQWNPYHHDTQIEVIKYDSTSRTWVKC